LRRTVPSRKDEDAKAVALRLLTVRDRSAYELRTRLARQFSDEDVEGVIQYLKDIGYLDDQRYALNYVEYRNRFRPTGNYLLRLELSSKGITEDIIDRVLNTPEQEYQLAMELAAQRLGRLQREDALSRCAKVYKLLQRRGFPSAAARKVIGELLDRDPETDYN
jgi:regulatory protein